MITFLTSQIFVSAAFQILIITHFILRSSSHHATGPYEISIDCGMDEDGKGEEDGDEIYKSDVEFTNAGVNRKISDEYVSATQNFQQLLTTVRSFTDGDYNCYTFNPPGANANKYLIRALFMYGNYDSKGQPPSFDLYLDVNQWDRVNFTDASEIVIKEIIHHPKTDYIHVCLLKNGSSTPFISALEIMELNSTIYNTQFNHSLILCTRLDYGSSSPNKFERYHDDEYERIWETYVETTEWNNIGDTTIGELLSDNSYRPSAQVMSTAIQPSNENDSIRFNFSSEPTQQFYFYLYFLEVEELRANQTRKFNIFLNNALWADDPFVPMKIPTTLYSTHSVGGANSLNFLIQRTSDSTLPPILNALEHYMVKTFLQLPTEPIDADAIIKIKKEYEIKRNWQGDPCMPLNYKWDGIECYINDRGEPYIISLNLSLSELAEDIIPSFSDFLSLETLKWTSGAWSKERVAHDVGLFNTPPHAQGMNIWSVE